MKLPHQLTMEEEAERIAAGRALALAYRVRNIGDGQCEYRVLLPGEPIEAAYYTTDRTGAPETAWSQDSEKPRSAQNGSLASRVVQQ